MNNDKLNKLNQINLTTIDTNENNVKHQIVIPFMELFEMVNHKFEHVPQGSRIRIDIKSGRIIIETKSLNENLDNHIQQLKNYSDKEESTVLSLLTNGRLWRTYSPHWRRIPTFSERIIYEFELTDLKDTQFLKRLEKILDFSNYENEEYFEHIEERENEILIAKKEIEEIKKEKANLSSKLQEDVVSLNEEKKKLSEQITQIDEQVKFKRQEISDINNEAKISEIQEKIKEYYIPGNKPTPIVLRTQSQYIESKESNTISERRVLNMPKNGVLAYGRELPDKRFEVLENSAIRKDILPWFMENKPKLVTKRKQYENDGTIVDNKFTRPVIFNTISEATTFLSGVSANGDGWKADK